MLVPGPKMATASVFLHQSAPKEAGFFIRPLATGIYLINRKFRLVSVLFVKSFHDFPWKLPECWCPGRRWPQPPCSFINPPAKRGRIFHPASRNRYLPDKQEIPFSQRTVR